MAGSILAERPRLWPETVRGLIVHSAEWTPPMRVWIDGCGGRKRRIHRLVRRYGYGAPDLDRALRSARNDLTLMVEDELRPFQRDGRGTTKTREMKLHALPWPRAELAAIGNVAVELRATLSYFVRFRVETATESIDEFRSRINQAARDEEEGTAAASQGGDEWLLGTARDVGSIHSDVWRGTAADLAARDAIGVYPVGGWWEEKPYLDRFDASARYALIVTIRLPGIDVDIYTPVAAQIAIAITI